MRRYYISQRFCITLCVGITFRNVYYIMRFNSRVITSGLPMLLLVQGLDADAVGIVRYIDWVKVCGIVE